MKKWIVVVVFAVAQSLAAADFVVTNVADDGAGSLRQAILDANASCTTPQPCGILFRIPAPVPESGWFTIEPRTPLPQIESSIIINGLTQTQTTGNTNPDGPEIEISGARLTEGSGLRVRSYCITTINDLAVNSFPGYGIEVRERPESQCLDTGGVSIHHTFLGTDARGRTARPNQRGLGITAANAVIADNLISGNLRAGIHAVDGSYAEITRNRIGVANDGSPLGNGAGIFVDMGEGSSFLGFQAVDITENVIAYNRGMAVARTRRGQILITKNSMYGNLQQGIDAGVDGMTQYSLDDRAVPNAPLLYDAAYDAVRNETTIHGHVRSAHQAHFHRIDVYVSSGLSTWGTPQAEQFVASVDVPNAQDFNVTVPGDLRGKWITATHITTYSLGAPARWHPREIAAERLFDLTFDTSELSNPIRIP